MNTDRIADIRARCEAASKGADEVYDWRIADADLIAHAREDIPYLLEQLAKSEAECERLREVQRWIPVNERLPENGYALACCSSGNRETTFFGNGRSGDLEDLGYEVTHWMPLPAPPEEID